MELATFLYVTFMVIYLLIVCSTVLVIVLDNRQPVKTIAWILVVSSLPVLGLIIYFFFGRNHKKNVLISRTCAIQLARRSAYRYFRMQVPDIPEEHRQLINLFRRQSMAFPYPENQLNLYVRGQDLLSALIEDIRRARHHIHLEFYIWEDDCVGNLVLDELARKVAEGVKVRVVYDDVGCWKVRNAFFERMKSKGIEVAVFMPVRFPKFTSKVNFRNHRKIVVIDGGIGYVGGMNLADRYFYNQGNRLAWRDSHLRIEGSAVCGLQRAFLADWYVAQEELITDACYYPSEFQFTGYVGDAMMRSGKSALVQIVTSMPMNTWQDIMQGMVLALLRAKKYCFIQSPYFMPTDRLLYAMQTAALSGVDVRLMIPERADTKLLTWASRSYLMDVMKAGVRVYLYQDTFLHAKTWVSDDSLSSCGSTNMDFRSLEHNFEVNAFIFDHKMALVMKRIFLEDQNKCRLLNLHSWEERSKWRHLGESFIRLLSPLL